MIESNDQDWGLCDHGPVGRDLDDYNDVEAGTRGGGDEDDDSPLEQLAYLAAGIEAGLAGGAARLETRLAGPGVLRCGPPSRAGVTRSTLTGEPLPVPAARRT